MAISANLSQTENKRHSDSSKYVFYGFFLNVHPSALIYMAPSKAYPVRLQQCVQRRHMTCHPHTEQEG